MSNKIQLLPSIFEIDALGDIAQIPIYTEKKKGKRSYSIRVDEDNTLCLSTPLSTTREEMLELLVRHKSWILKTYSKKMAHKNIIDAREKNGEILYFGQNIKLEDLRSRATLQSLSIKDFLKQKLLDYIDERCQIYVHNMNQILNENISYKNISINTAQGRFGSCSYSNNLNFSLMLVFTKSDLIDYVVVHELSHIVHKDHSARFWQCVGKIYPSYKSARAELKAEGNILQAMLRQIMI